MGSEAHKTNSRTSVVLERFPIQIDHACIREELAESVADRIRNARTVAERIGQDIKTGTLEEIDGRLAIVRVLEDLAQGTAELRQILGEVRGRRNRYGSTADIIALVHDVLLQCLGAMSLQLQVTIRRNGRDFRDELLTVQEIADSLLEEIELSVAEWTPTTRTLSFRDGLRRVTESFSNRFCLDLVVEAHEVCCEHLIADLSFERQADLLWIINEALTNAGKHSGGRTVVLSMRCVDGDVIVRVEDDGWGYGRDDASDAHLGIKEMRTRAKALGGCLEFGASCSGGAAVVLNLNRPLDA